jgi:hypothetical protein
MANQVTPASLKQFATAALELNHQQFLAQVVRYSIMADLSIQERLDICNVFRFSNRPQEAWEIFIAGYHFLDFRGPSDEHLFIRVTFFLVDLCNNPTTPDRLRELVWHYVRRMKNIVEEPFKPAPIQFAKNEVVTLNRGPQTRILGSDRLPRKSVDDYNDQAERFDAWRQRVGNPSVREFRNVFVNRLGQIWRPDGKIIRDNVSRIPMASHEAGAFARRIPVACLAINRYGGNFHHWMADLVPSLAWRLQEGAKDIPLIISDNATDFMRSSLAVLGISPSSLEEAGDAVFVECLYDGETTGPKILPDGAHRSVLERFREEADRLSGSDSLHAPLVYISRRDSKIRALSNEEALEKAVAEIGFRVLQFGSLSLLEQIAAIRHAKFVLGPHGAGFTHILFSRPETHFFEITPYQPGSAQNRYCMARLSRIMGNHHTIWLEPVDSATGAWSASIEQIVKIVAGLIPLVDSSAEV